jgi:hypothetical protein
LCSCGSEDLGAAPPGQPIGPGPGEVGPSGPDAETLPPSARLISEPADSIDDLPGRYAQPFAWPGQISTITIGTPSQGVGAYDLYRSCGLPTCVHETGLYHALPTNPAIGFAFISLRDALDQPRETYLIDLLWRDDKGTLVAVQVRQLLPTDAIGPTQVWWRLPGTVTRVASDDGAATTTPVEPPATTTAATLTDPPILPGVYLRPLPIYGDIGAITIEETSWNGEHAEGTYTAAYPYCLPWCFPEVGDYQLDLTNVATGTGRLTVVPEGNPTQAHAYVVLAIWRGLDGTAAAIQLERIDGITPSGPPFVLFRQWWTKTP